MQSVREMKEKKLHARNIEVNTYDYDGQRIMVEGFLKDERFQESRLVTGEKFPSGVIHHMSVRMLVNCTNLMIEDINVELISVPRGICHETRECLAPVKGLIITKGFTSKVKKIAGGNKGCTHLVELLLTMAPAAIQGFAAYQAQKPTGVDQDHLNMMAMYLVDTCHAWREDGPLINSFKKLA